MDDLFRYGLAARADWRAYHTASAEAYPCYHNRPDCREGWLISDVNIRVGQVDRPLCDKCKRAEKASCEFPGG